MRVCIGIRARSHTDKAKGGRGFFPPRYSTPGPRGALALTTRNFHRDRWCGGAQRSKMQFKTDKIILLTICFPDFVKFKTKITVEEIDDFFITVK